MQRRESFGKFSMHGVVPIDAETLRTFCGTI